MTIVDQSRVRALLIAAVLGVLLAACGGGDSAETSGAPTTDSAPADDTAATAAPMDQGDATGDGESSGNGDRVIGLAAITLQSPAVGVQIETAERAAELLGWELVVTNADGDPAKMAADVSGLVNQGVDAILDVAISPAQAQEGFRAAREQDIPIIAIGAPLDDPEGFFAATYAPSDAEMSELLAGQMIEDLDGTGQALSLNATGLPALEIRRETLLEATADTDITVAVDHETDLSNAVQDTQTAVANSLRANPDVNVIWALQDFEFVTALTTIANQGLQPAGIYGYYPPPEALQALRDWTEGDAPLAAADSPIAYVPWYAFDALVNKWIAEEDDWTTDMSVKPLPTALMTPADVPDGDSFPWEPFEPFFVERWTEAGAQLNG